MEAMVGELIQLLGEERAEECLNGLLNNDNPEEVARWLTHGIYYVRDEDLSLVTMPLSLVVRPMEMSFKSQQPCSMSMLLDLTQKYQRAMSDLSSLRRKRKRKQHGCRW